MLILVYQEYKLKKPNDCDGGICIKKLKYKMYLANFLEFLFNRQNHFLTFCVIFRGVFNSQG